MRRMSSLAVFAALIAGGVAQAQQPVDPYPAPQAAPQPVNPYASPNAYPPPAPYYPPPPTVYVPAPPTYVPPPPPLYIPPPPVYVYPPTVYYRPPLRPRLRCWNCATKPAERVRHVSVGVSGTVLAVNQKIGNDDMVLGGAGLHLRVRSSGRWGFEVMQSFLHADFWNGNFQRSSYPLQMSAMVYLRPNREDVHFNLYGLAGVGVMFDTIQLLDENRNQVSQDFIEWEGHFGLGAELRFKWFAIEADGRMHGFLRDDSSAPASYYSNVSGAPIQGKSYGFSGNLYVSLWF